MSPQFDLLAEALCRFGRPLAYLRMQSRTLCASRAAFPGERARDAVRTRHARANGIDAAIPDRGRLASGAVPE